MNRFLRPILAVMMIATATAGYVQADVPVAHDHMIAPDLVECAGDLTDVASARGAGTCFGLSWTSENCCDEFVVVGVIAGATGNLPVLVGSAVFWYFYCRNL